jgi:adenylate kinase family enzyme
MRVTLLGIPGAGKSEPAKDGMLRQLVAERAAGWRVLERALRARTDTDPRITLGALRRAAESEEGRRALVLDGFPMSRSLVAEVEAAIGASVDLAFYLQIQVTEAAVDHQLADGRA